MSLGKFTSKIIMVLVLISIINVASAYYNDEGNDSCLTIYSDAKEYNCKEATCKTILAFSNQCGEPITDTQIGIFLREPMLDKIQFKKIYVWLNGEWVDKTQQMIRSLDVNNMPMGRGNWYVKFGWKDVTLPTGNRIVKIIFELLEPVNGAFKVGARSKSDHSIRSILDPTFRSAFFPFTVPSNYTTFNTEVTGGYCSLLAGQTQGYCDTNFLTPSPTVLEWYDVNIVDNYDDTNVNTIWHDNERDLSFDLAGTVAGKVELYAGTYGSLDINFTLTNVGATQNLFVYLCRDGYTIGNFTADVNCSLVKTYLPADIIANWTTYSFNITEEIVGDTNYLQIIFYCPDCTLTPVRYYALGIDTDSTTGKSFESINGGTSWALLSNSNELMVHAKHKASHVNYQYTTDEVNFYKINDGNLESVNSLDGKLKIRSWLTRYNTSYTVNVDSLDINYSNNAPPSIPELIYEPDTNQTSEILDWNASTDDEFDSPIMYNLRMGNTYGSNEHLDTNTFNNDFNVTTLHNGIFYWSVRACDDANGELPFYSNCSAWANDENFNVNLPNASPSIPVLIDEPNGQFEGQVLLDWIESSDLEDDTITYNLILGTTPSGTEILDVNTLDSNYLTSSLTSDVYYWSVRACDDEDCSSYSIEDTFRIIQEGEFMITALIDNTAPYVEYESITPNYWDGTGEINVTFNCVDPNGIADLNSAHIDVSGTLIISDIPVTFVPSTGFAYAEISSYFTQEGDYIIDPICVDDGGLESTAGTVFLYYTPSYSVIIDNGAEITNDLIVDLNLSAPNILYFALSCDGDDWSDWVTYTTSYDNFNMGSGNNGCEPHGAGVYYVYVAFADLNNVYTAFDSIIAEGLEKEYEGYVNPEETTETITSYFSLVGYEGISIGIVIVIALVSVALYVSTRQKRRY